MDDHESSVEKKKITLTIDPDPGTYVIKIKKQSRATRTLSDHSTDADSFATIGSIHPDQDAGSGEKVLKLQPGVHGYDMRGSSLGKNNLQPLSSIHSLSDPSGPKTGLKSPNKIQKVYRSRSADTNQPRERNNNKANLPSWIARIKCFVGLGTPEECNFQSDDQKPSSAPACLTVNETTKLVEEACASLKDRIEQLETKLSEKLTEPPRDCPKKKKKYKKSEPYLQFYSKYCAKPPKPCIKLTDKLTTEEEDTARVIATRSRSPTPCLRPPSPCLRSPTPCLPSPSPCKKKKRTSRSPKKIRPKCPDISKEKPLPSDKMCTTCCLPPCTSYCSGHLGEFQARSNSYTNMDCMSQSLKPHAKSNLYEEQCECLSQAHPNHKKRGRPTSLGRSQEVKAPTSFHSPRKPDTKQCKCQSSGSRQKVSPQRSQCETRQTGQTTRPCQPFCRPASTVCTTCCGLGNDTNCTFSGLGKSYSRSKSGDSLCKTLLAKYRHQVSEEYASGRSSYSHGPFINEESPMLPVPGINRTNSRKSVSPDTRYTSYAQQNAIISYSYEPFKDKTPHKELNLQKAIYTPCAKQIGPRSPVELFHALKRVESDAKRKKIHKKYSIKGGNKSRKPPFTMEVLEKEINEQNQWTTSSSMPGISEANTNNGALSPDLDNSYIGHLYTRYETQYCQGNCRKNQTLAIKKLNHYFDHLYPCSTSAYPHFDGRRTYHGSRLSWSCQNNNYGEENNFRFFRKYLNITPAQSDSLHSNVDAGDAQPPYQDGEAALNDTEEGASEIKGISQPVTDAVDDRISRLDKWILGEFPEEVSATTCKSKPIKRKTSAYGVSKFVTRNKKTSTRTGQRRVSTNIRGGGSSLTTSKRSILPKPSETIKNKSPQRLLSAEVSPRKASESAFSSPEQYTPQRKLDESMAQESYAYYGTPEKSTIKKLDERGVTDMENKRGTSIESSRKSNDKSGKTLTYYPNRMKSPRSPMTKSAEMKYVPNDDEESDHAPDEEDDCEPSDFEHFPLVMGESSVDGGGFVSTAKEMSRKSFFLSKLSSMWNSKTKVADSTDSLPDQTMANDLVLFGRESSVDIDGTESSVDMVDGSSNNEYCSLIKDSACGSGLSNEASHFLRNVNSIQDGKCIQGRISEIDNSKNIDTSSNEESNHGVPDIIEFNSICSSSNDDYTEFDMSTNNGGNTTDDTHGTSVDESKVEHDKMESPVATMLKNSESSTSPIGIPAQSVLSARDASMNLQQLMSSSGVTWSKVSADDVDVASIRRAKDDFMKRLRAKKAGGVVKAESDTPGDGPRGRLPLDLPVVSLKKTGHAEVAEALTEDTLPDENAAVGMLCPQ